MAAPASDLLRHFRLLHSTKFNDTWQKAKSQRHVPSVCLPIRKTRRPPDIFCASPLNAIQQNLTRNKISTSSTKFVFFGPIKSRDGHPCLWLAVTILISPMKPLNGVKRNLIGSKIFTFSTTFEFFRPIRKPRWPPRLLIGWGIFDFLWKCLTEFNETL